MSKHKPAHLNGMQPSSRSLIRPVLDLLDLCTGLDAPADLNGLFPLDHVTVNKHIDLLPHVALSRLNFVVK